MNEDDHILKPKQQAAVMMMGKMMKGRGTRPTSFPCTYTYMSVDYKKHVGI